MSSSVPASRSPSGTPGGDGYQPVNRHILTPLERQRLQLEKLLKDPSKEVFIPSGPKEKELRAPREMMKNVQGSSAGAGSGEFHVYKQNRRREYERLKIMDEKAKAEEEAAAFEARQKARQEASDAKTSKNRAKRLKRKPNANKLANVGPGSNTGTETIPTGVQDSGAGKRRKLGNPGGVVFKRPGEESDDDEEEEDDETRGQSIAGSKEDEAVRNVPIVQEAAIIIRDDD